jgi:dihydroxy-acid dehydratase
MAGLALLKAGDRVRIGLRKGTADVLVHDAERPERRAALEGAEKYQRIAQTPGIPRENH